MNAIYKLATRIIIIFLTDIRVILSRLTWRVKPLFQTYLLIVKYGRHVCLVCRLSKLLRPFKALQISKELSLPKIIALQSPAVSNKIFNYSIHKIQKTFPRLFLRNAFLVYFVSSVFVLPFKIKLRTTANKVAITIPFVKNI